MSDVLVFPDTRAAIFDLVDGGDHVGREVSAYYHMPADPATGSTGGPWPLVVITMEPGTQTFIDRTDRIVVDVYSDQGDAMTIAQSVQALLVGVDVETPSGYLDEIRADQVPHEVPYYSDTIGQAALRVMVITRPVD